MYILRYFFHIAYNGSKYRGWQRQRKGVASIQQVFEENLSLVLKSPITCIGCGRTDAEVHASQFFFHADIKDKWDFDLLARLNIMLPRDIAIFDIIEVNENSHAQFDATGRTYDYYFHTYKDPFLNELSALYIEKNLDLNKIKKALFLIQKYDNFRAFCLTPVKNTTTLCNISEAKLYSDIKGDKFRLKISSNRFLKGMIRIIVRMLLDIGNDKLSLERFESFLVTKKISSSHNLAFPQGLYLSKVTYPFLDIPPRTEFSAFQNCEKNIWKEI